MADERTEIWVVRDTEASVPSRAVSLRKLRRGVEIGRLRLDYQVAHVGTDRWVTLAELFESRRSSRTVVLTESSVVTSAPNRVSAEEAARVLERAPRPRLRRIERSAFPAESEPFALVPTDTVSESELLWDPEPELTDADLLPPSDPNPDFSPPSEAALGSGAFPELTLEPPPAGYPEGPSVLDAYHEAPNASGAHAPVFAASPVVVAYPNAPSPVDAYPDAPSPVGVYLEAPNPIVADAEAASPVAAQAEAATRPIVTVAVTPPPYVSPALAGPSESLRVVVTDVHMPFGSMVIFMIKWAFASIPAMLIVAFVLGALGMLGTMALAALGHAIR